MNIEAEQTFKYNSLIYLWFDTVQCQAQKTFQTTSPIVNAAIIAKYNFAIYNFLMESNPVGVYKPTSIKQTNCI